MGNDADDDLPSRVRISVNAQSSTIHQLLLKTDMFPKNSNCHKIVTQCAGDGYKALKQILFHVLLPSRQIMIEWQKKRCRHNPALVLFILVVKGTSEASTGNDEEFTSPKEYCSFLMEDTKEA